MKTRIVHVTSSLKIGGAEKILCDLIEQLHTYEQYVLYIHDGPHRHELEKMGISCKKLQGITGGLDPWIIVNLYRELKKIKPDTVHSLLWIATLLSRLVTRLLKIYHVMALHNNIEQDGYIRNWLDWLTIRMVMIGSGGKRYRDNYTIIVVSGQVKESAQRYIYPKEDNKYIVIHNGVDAQRIYTRVAQSTITGDQLGLLNNNYIIGTVGRLVPVKNYELLIDLFAQIHANYSHVRLIIVGSGPLESELRSRARKNGLEDYIIFIVGKSSFEYYHLFDCFVQPSNLEGVSMALLEAMSCSIPCVVMSATKNKYHPVVHNGINGLVGYGTPDFLDMMIKMVTDRTIALEYAKEGNTTVINDFSLQKMVFCYKKVFSGLSQ